MAVWTLEVRVPGAGGAWTALSTGKFVNLGFRKDLNQLPWLNVDLWGLSAAEEALVVQGNDIRAMAATTERWYGQIQDADQDPQRRKWRVHALGKGILAFDRAWASRREWVNLPPEVIADEVLGNVMDEELQAGLVVHLDGETFADDGLGLKDLSGNNHDADFKPLVTDTSSRVGRWGLAREFDGVDDYMEMADHADLEPASRFTFVWHLNLVDGGTADILDKQVASNNDAYLVRVLTSSGFIRVLLGNGTTTTTLTSSTLAYPYDGEWHDLVVRWDDADDVVWVELDGETENIGTFAGPIDYSTPSTKTVRIGGQWFGNDPTGGIDLFLFYNDRRLSLAQSRAAAGRGVFEGGLLADSFDPISFRAEEDTRLNIVDALAKAIGAEHFADRDASDRDRFRLVARQGSASPTDTFQFGQTILDADRQVDRAPIHNDIVALGYGDGQNQLRSRIWHATTIRAILSTDYTAASTGPISIPDTTDYPANGVAKLGGERIEYTGKTATQLGTTSVTRAYTADGYESLDAYLHKKGVAVWLHVDTTTTPDTTYDPSSPQTGSSIQVNTHRQGPPFVDRGIIDQDTLDRLAQRLLDSYKDPRESIVLKVKESDVVADIGDDVAVLDRAGAAYENSPYRVHALQGAQRNVKGGTPLWTFELGSPRDVAEAELARIREEMRLSRSYGQGATNEFSVVAFDNIVGATTPPGTPLVIIFETPVDAKVVNEVRVLSLAMQDFRGYQGAPSIARTSSELSTGSHSHGYNRPSHQHGAAPTLDIPDAATTSDGSPLHTHPVTYVLHTVAQHDAEDPAAQQTNPTGDGVGHNHGGNVGPHSHGAPAAGNAGATVAAASAPDRAHPDQDILTTGWSRTNAGIPFWDNIDDDPLSPGDGNFCFDTNPSEEFLKIGLGDLADPVSSAGHIIRMRAVRFDLISGTASLKAELREGGTLRATLGPVALTTTEATFSYTLSAGEANSIGDYTNLQLWFDVTARTGDSVARIEAAEFEVPGHTHTITSQSHTHGASDATDLGDPTSGNSAVGGSHTHALDPDGANHLHGEPSDGSATGTSGTTLGHTHTWTIAAHDHGNLANFNEPSLTTDAEDDSFHDHSMQSHSHIAGIFETAYLSPSVGLRIDGTLRTAALGGPWTADQVDIDITEYVSAVGTHTLEFYEEANGKLGRLYAAILIKFFIQSGVGE